MADETRTPQTEPAEGSRKVIEHELERQSGSGGESGPASGKSKNDVAGGGEGGDKAESRH